MSQEEIIQINGVRLWTAIQGTGQPMVLCHGGPGGTEDPRFRQSVYNLSMPVLFLHGACDPRPSHFIERLASKLSCGTFASIPESGHYFWIEKPDEVKTSLRQFVCGQVMRQNP